MREVTGKEYESLIDLAISIHTSRAGGDCSNMHWQPGELLISIHTSRAGGDPVQVRAVFLQTIFQSTPPVREVTLRHEAGCQLH